MAVESALRAIDAQSDEEEEEEATGFVAPAAKRAAFATATKTKAKWKTSKSIELEPMRVGAGGKQASGANRRRQPVGHLTATASCWLRDESASYTGKWWRNETAAAAAAAATRLMRRGDKLAARCGQVCDKWPPVPKLCKSC